MSQPHRKRRSAVSNAFSPIVSAALLAAALSQVPAQASVIVTSFAASGSWSADGSAVTDAPLWLNTSTAQDRLYCCDYAPSTPSVVGLHDYGDTSGNFGSRSSGYGVYDVTGSFVITVRLLNDTGSAQNAAFNFHITPGQLSISPFGFAAGQFVEAGIGFHITTTAANGAAFDSTATLRSDDSNALSYSQTGVDIYGGSGTYRSVNGGAHSLDLGLLAAGDWVDVTYEIDTYAKGNAIPSGATTIPAWDEVIPAHYVEFVDCGYGYGATLVAGGANVYGGPSECTTRREYVPEQIIHHPEQIVEGVLGGSHASSGDPFDCGLYNVDYLPDPNTPFISDNLPRGNVPEPGPLSLLGFSAAALAWTRRRKLRSQG